MASRAGNGFRSKMNRFVSVYRDIFLETVSFVDPGATSRWRVRFFSVSFVPVAKQNELFGGMRLGEDEREKESVCV